MLEGGSVGVMVHIEGRFLHGFNCLGRGAERVLVAGQLHHFVEAELASDFGDGLSGRVRLHAEDVRANGSHSLHDG